MHGGQGAGTALPAPLALACSWDEVVFTHALEYKEDGRTDARIRYEMGASGAGRSPTLSDV